MGYTLDWSDYLVFGFWLLIYSLIGIYQRFRIPILNQLGLKVRHKQERREYDGEEVQFFGDRQLSTFPIFCSIMASFLSPASLMGLNAEVYNFGIQFILMIVPYCIAFPMVSEIYMPVIYKLRLRSAHEYLEMRFSKIVRWITSLIYCLQMWVYISLVLYAPALAFSQVSGIPLWLSLISTGLVGTFYTSLGGIRAVVWTDVCQLFILIGGMVALVVVCVKQVGGLDHVLSVALEGKRLQSFDFSPNPLLRHSFWTLTVGGTGMILSIYATNQTQLQRYISCNSLQTARKAILLNLPFTSLFLIVQLTAGLATYVYFVGCDPVKSEKINRYDQLLPYIIVVLFRDIPAVRGLFLAIVFAAALSTVSSGVNSLAAVILEDIIRPMHFSIFRKDLDDRSNTILVYTLATVIGLSTVGLAFGFTVLGPRMLQFALSLFGSIGGPILGIFSLGMFVPCINAKGATVGLLLSIVVGLTLTTGAILHPTSTGKLHTETSNCTPPVNISVQNSTIDNSPSIFSLSYLYYSWACVLTASISSFIVSAFSGFNNANPVQSNLIAWQVRKIGNCLPARLPRQWVNDENNIHADGNRNFAPFCFPTTIVVKPSPTTREEFILETVMPATTKND